MLAAQRQNSAFFVNLILHSADDETAFLHDIAIRRTNSCVIVQESSRYNIPTNMRPLKNAVFAPVPPPASSSRIEEETPNGDPPCIAKGRHFFKGLNNIAMLWSKPL